MTYCPTGQSGVTDGEGVDDSAANSRKPRGREGDLEAVPDRVDVVVPELVPEVVARTQPPHREEL